MPRSSSPHLGVDTQRLLGSRAGVARYLASLLREWAGAELPFGRVTLFTPAPLPDDVLPEEHPFDVRIVPGPSPRLWGQWQLPRAARDVDLLFCPAYVAPLAYRGRYAVVMHDALLEVLPGAFSRRARLRRGLHRRSARRASCVLAPSTASKRDLERLYGLDPERVHAIRLGVDDRFRHASEDDVLRVRELYGLGARPVVLFVGKLSKRRNLPNLVRAVAALRSRGHPDHLLVLVGENHLGLRLEELGQAVGIGDGLRVLGFVPDDDLPALYRAAEFFVYPSDYEGFGIPVLEAMAAGTPAVTLDNSALAEVAGDAGVLLRSAGVEELTDAFGRLAADPALRAEYVERGRERAAQFTWAATARQTLEKLREAAA
jgi:glycosyltransferase involved in cell wall biosynthesis